MPSVLADPQFTIDINTRETSRFEGTVLSGAFVGHSILGRPLPVTQFF